MKVDLPCDLTAPERARITMRGFAEDHHIPVCLDEAVLIASELVTNAVCHARAPVELACEVRADTLLIAVRDGDPDVDAVAIPAARRSGSGGRGLGIVAALATRWGTTRQDHDKTVWASLPLLPPRSM